MASNGTSFTSESGRAAAKAQARTYTDEEIISGLMALIANGGSPSKASETLKQQNINVNTTTLTAWKVSRAAQYADLHEKYREPIEKQALAKLLDNAALAMEVERLGLEKAEERLNAGKDADPARTASHASRVKQSSIEKWMTMQGRPTQITETRDLPAILRSLVGRNVLKVVGASSTEDDSPEPDAKE